MTRSRLFTDFEKNKFLAERRRRQAELGRFIGASTFSCKSLTATTTIADEGIFKGDWLLTQELDAGAGAERASGNFFIPAAVTDGEILVAHTSAASVSARTFAYFIMGAI